ISEGNGEGGGSGGGGIPPAEDIGSCLINDLLGQKTGRVFGLLLLTVILMVGVGMAVVIYMKKNYPRWFQIIFL
ncbi:hypothetical protein ACFL2E_11600, partial [Thermodesulfobacteriota bacterium]